MFFRPIKNKLKSKKGETFVETLYSLLIVVPAMIMLAGAIVTAARINKESRDSRGSDLPVFSYGNKQSDGSILKQSGTGSVTFTDTSLEWYNELDPENHEGIYFYFK